MARSPASVNNTSSTYIPVTPSSRRNTVVMRRALSSLVVFLHPQGEQEVPALSTTYPFHPPTATHSFSKIAKNGHGSAVQIQPMQIIA